jgi:HEAT repeat protein
MRAVLIMLAVCMPLATVAEAAPALAGRMLLRLQSKNCGWLGMSEAFHYLGQHQIAEAAAPCLAILDDATHSGYIRAQALLTLVRVGGRADLQRAVADSDPRLRAAAAESLQVLGAEADATVIEALLTDAEPEVRYRAIAALAAQAGPAVWPRIEPMLATVDESQTKWVARTLALLASDVALERLLALSRSGSRRRAWIDGVSGVRKPGLIMPLLVVASETGSSGSDFSATLAALRQHDRAALLRGMHEVLEEPDARSLRMVATLVQRLLADKQLGEGLAAALDEITDTGAIRATLLALGHEELEPSRFEKLFLRFLDHSDAQVRTLAVRNLARCPAAKLFAALRERVNDESSQVIRAALTVLRNGPSYDAPVGTMVSYLKKPLSSNDVSLRDLAIDVLSYAGSKADFEPAMALYGAQLRGADSEQRELAAATLGRIAPLEAMPDLAEAQGFLSYFRLLGTFINDEAHSGFATVHPPEREIDFDASYVANYIWRLSGGDKEAQIEREITWNMAVVDRADGRFNVAAMAPPPPDLAVAYLVADFHVPTARELLLSVDGDDAFRLWLNAEKITEAIASPAGDAQAKTLGIALKAGANRLMIKTANIKDAWWVRVRLTDEAGLPVRVQAVKE